MHTQDDDPPVPLVHGRLSLGVVTTTVVRTHAEAVAEAREDGFKHGWAAKTQARRDEDEARVVAAAELTTLVREFSREAFARLRTVKGWRRPRK